MTLRGIYPILATCFHPDGTIDYDSQKRLINFCIDSGVHGLVMLANASEGHLLSDAERRDVLTFGLKTIDQRVPVIATVNHPASQVAAESVIFAEAQGAAAIMTLPPFFGRCRAGLGEIFSHFQTISNAIKIPLILQDHVLTDISLSVNDLSDMVHRIERLSYIKLEAGNIIYKARKPGFSDDWQTAQLLCVAKHAGLL